VTTCHTYLHLRVECGGVYSSDSVSDRLIVVHLYYLCDLVVCMYELLWLYPEEGGGGRDKSVNVGRIKGNQRDIAHCLLEIGGIGF